MALIHDDSATSLNTVRQTCMLWRFMTL